MEELNVVLSAISTVGFPIFMCLLMFNQNKETTKIIAENTKAIDELKITISSLASKED